ncbi:hypothetical protein Taro_001607 [Colocasia esculenta]|uniref:Lecithin-cholesterol acyltransferase-like 1 n=1 Tax=Colocasia esculenta TaxID=4460 RepID=A0A843TGF1_COLES|nr:hypothetical protein [Colocasia esculenta]
MGGAAPSAAATSYLPVAISLLLLLPVRVSAAGRLHPLVVIPGTGTSQIYARLTDDYVPSNGTVCGGANRPAGWFRLWKDKRLLRDPLVQCFTELMAIHYDPALDDYRNTPGVETMVPRFGSVDAFRHRDPDDPKDTPEMAIFLERLEALGYRDGEDLFGAPYDYRYGLAAPGRPSLAGTRFLDGLRALVERAASANGGRPVVILGNSLGGLLAHQLLTRSPPAWRRRFVKHFLAVAVPWGGCVLEMEVFASGISVAGLAPLVLRAEMATYESNLWLLPSPGAFAGRPLAVTPERNYSAMELLQFLSDVGFSEAVRPYQSRILPMIARLDPPGVPVTCVSGTGVPTREMLVYGDGFGRDPEVVLGDGDGTVNMESLVAAEAAWVGVEGQPLTVVKVAKATHGSILLEEETWKVILEQVMSSDDDDADVRSTGLSSAAA